MCPNDSSSATNVRFSPGFYDGATANREAIGDENANEYLRTFSGREGLLGAMGVYRAAFTTIEQTKALLTLQWASADAHLYK